MENLKFDKEIAALLVIDPYNDFIFEGGKLWDCLKTVAEANDCVPHMLQVLDAVRKAEIRIFYARHHRYRPDDYETWKHPLRSFLNDRFEQIFLSSPQSPWLTPPVQVLSGTQQSFPSLMNL